MKRIGLHVLGMFLLGLLAMLAFAAIVQLRIGRPIAPALQARPAATAVASLAQGLTEDLQIAFRSLPASQTEAVRALDGAKRLSEVGEAAVGEPFRVIREKVTEARRAVANGNPTKARQLLAQATAAPLLAEQPAAAPSGLRQYTGATVVDSHGTRIGEITAVSNRDGHPVLQVAVGGLRDVFGFIDVGGHTMLASPDTLVFGTLKKAGTTLVVWSGAPQEAMQAAR